MGPIQKELVSWCLREAKGPGCNRALSYEAQVFYIGAVHSLFVQQQDEPNNWEEAMSEAIEAAEALGV